MGPNSINSKSDDRELLISIRNGDQRAFAILFERHWKRLYRAALRNIDDRDVAEDIIQDCFISLWEKSASREIENVGAYLYQSVRYKCFMHIRSGTISKKHLDRINSVATPQNPIEEFIDERELQAVLDHSMATLPDKCREIFYLSRFELLPNKKIAEQLHISPKTVENQITKALRILRVSVDKMISIILMFTLS